MYASYKELKKRGIRYDIKELEQKLVQLGHEVEEIKTLENDKLVVGFVEDIRKHEKADKLNVCVVRVPSGEKLQIVCGAPNVAAGQYVIVALPGCELAEMTIEYTKIRGEESQGMICSLPEIGVDSSLLATKEVEGIYVFPEEPTHNNALVALDLEDVIFDLSITVDRGYALSYEGLVKDLRALQGDDYHHGSLKTVKPDFLNERKVTIKDNSCYLFNCVDVVGVTVAESSFLIKSFLYKHKIKPQNNVVDYANYLMICYGIPIHVYDKDCVSGDLEISLKNNFDFVGLDESEYKITETAIVIEDEEKVCGLGSVMGSNATKVKPETTNLLIEIAYFNEVSVRYGAKNLGRKTEASIRGEKGVNYAIATEVLCSFIEYLQTKDLNAKSSSILTVVNENFDLENEQVIKLEYSEISNVLGIEIPPEEAQGILNRLGFITQEYDGYLDVKVPSYRLDIRNERDLIEEIIRLYGLDNIQIDDKEKIANMIKQKQLIENNPALQHLKLEQVFLNAGMNQVVTYSLVSEQILADFKGTVDNAVRVKKPLSKQREFYRQSFVPSLLEVARRNFFQQQKGVSFFELGQTYKRSEERIVENTLITGLMSGVKSSSYQGDEVYDFFDLKSVLNRFAKIYDLDLEIEKSGVEEYHFLNPYASGIVKVAGEPIGFIGLLHFDYIGKLKNDIYVFEIDITKLVGDLKTNIVYNTPSEFPTIRRDLTIVADDKITYRQVSEVFQDIEYLQSYDLSDCFKGEPIPKDHQALTFNLVFSSNKTLTNEEVDLRVQVIIDKIKESGYIFNE